MTRVGELWAGYSDDQRDAVARAVSAILRDDGAFVLAVARESRCGPVTDALGRAAEAIAADPYPYLIPDHLAGPREDPLVAHCAECGSEVTGEMFPRWDFDTHTLRWLGGGCYRQALLDDRLRNLAPELPIGGPA